MKNRLSTFLLSVGFACAFYSESGAATELQLVNGWTNAPFSTSNAEAFLDQGIVYLKGAIASGTSATAFTLPVSMRPSTAVYVSVDLCDANKGRLYIQPSGVVSVQTQSDFAFAQCFTSLDGASFAPSAAGFTALSLSNGWVNAPFATSNAAAAVIDGIVFLKGAIASGTSATAFTLPVAMRPATNVYVPVDLCGSAKGRLLILTSGEVSVQAEANFADAQCFTSLDGASFAPSATGFTGLGLSNGWVNAPFATSNAAAAMQVGIVYLKGAISSGTSATAFVLPVSMRPATAVYVPVDLCNAAKGRLVIQTSGAVRVEAVGDFSDAACFTSLDGAKFIPTRTGFDSLSLSNGWANGEYATQTAAVAMYDGIVHFKGAISNGSTNAVFTLPVTMRPDTYVYVPVDLCNAAPGRLVIPPTGLVTVSAATTFADAQCFVSLEGATFPRSATGFTDLALLNGWLDAPFATSNAAAARINGIVHLKGAVGSGAASQLFTLPLDMRPATDVYLLVGLCNAAKGRLVIQTSGAVSVVPLSGSFSDAQCFTSLDGAKFAPSSAGFASSTPLNGWLSAPFATSDAAASILRDIVYLKGAIAGGSNSSLFTLPPILRPEGTVYVPIDLCNAAKGRLIIQPSGTVSVQAQDTFDDATCFTSLDGAAYAVPEPGGSAALVCGVALLAWIHGSRSGGVRRAAVGAHDGRAS